MQSKIDMEVSFTDADFEEASEKTENWLQGLERQTMYSRRRFREYVAELQGGGVGRELLTITAFAKLADSTDSFSAMSRCVAEHCDDFIESGRELIETGGVLQAHADLMLTLDHHVVEMANALNRQRALATLIAEIIEADYPGNLFAN